MLVGLLFVDALVLPRRGGPLLSGARVEPEFPVEVVVPVLELEEHLVGFLFVLVVRRIMGLNEVEVEVPRRLGRGTFVGRAEEQVAAPVCLTLSPFDFVFPDLVAGDVGPFVGPHHAGECGEVVAVELAYV